MKLLNGIVLLFVIVEVSSQIDVLQLGDDLLVNDSDRDNIGDVPLNFNILDEVVDNAGSLDYFLEERPHDARGEVNEVETLGAPYADPTLHKWKHKLPHFHSHTHSHTYGIAHEIPHGIETAALVHPVNHHFSHQSQSVYSQNKQFSTVKGHHIETPVVVYPVNHQCPQPQSGQSINNQFSIHNDHGIDPKYPSANPNSYHWEKGLQHTAHSTYNQNSHQLINNQNVHLSGQNNPLDNFESSGKVIHPSDTYNPGIVNINGHSNTVIQSGTSKNYITSHNGQFFLHEKAAPSDIGDPLIGISMPVEEQIYWRNKPQVSDLQTNSGEILSPVVYDSDMNNILDLLDERSFYLTRPEVVPSGKQKHSEDAMRLHEIRSLDGQTDEGFNENYYQNEEKQQEQSAYPPVQSGDDVDYNLASPSLIQIPYNNYFHSYESKRNSRNRRSPRDINMNVLSDNSMFFNTSSWRLNEMNSKLNDTLNDYQNVVDDYRKKITDKRESLFVDLLDGIIGQFKMKEYKSSNEIKKMQKRAATITKLLNDPDARLDVPKTLDNIGVITRNAFEDERSPMYHVRQFMGSTKNAVLSAMKIPPQNLVIPSNYEIKNINPEEISELEDHMVSGINPKILSRSSFGNTESMETYGEAYPNDPFGIVETFARVGGAIRDSVRSGQNTLSHISDIAHNARKIYQTTKNSAPRILLPYAKAPVLKSRFKETKTAPLKKAIFISPKVLAVKDPVLGASNVEQDFVSMGNILDAIGLTKPNRDQIDLEKIVLKMPGQGETRGIYIPPIGEVKSINGRILPNSIEGNEKMKVKPKKQLVRMKERVASTNKVVKDSIAKTRNDISKTLDETKSRINGKKTDILQMKERNNIGNDINDLPQSATQGDISKIKGDKPEIKHFTKEEENEIIDTFLYNIFKIDTNPRERSKSAILRNRIRENESAINLKNNEKDGNESMLGLENNIPFSDIMPNITDSLLQETIKNITLDILKDEKKNSQMKTIKSNKINKEYLNRKKKVNPMKRPKIVLQSRFGDDNDTATTSPNNSTVLEFKGLDKNDEEAMRKVDEYVLNDVAAPMLSDFSNNEKVKNSFKLGNILELIEDPSVEESSNELKSEETGENEKVPAFSSRNLLWYPDVEDNQESGMLNTSDGVEKPAILDNTENKEIVALNLPPELMTPFMSRAANSNIGEVFDKEDEVQENNEVERNRMSFNLPSEIIVGSSQSNTPHFLKDERNEKAFKENTDGGGIVGLNLPPELMKPFMARGADADIDKTFTSDEANEYNAVVNDNNEMQNYLPILMMPLRTTKSVKKTLDEFLKKENETKHQILNIQENRLKNSRSYDIPKSYEGVAQPIKEQLYTVPMSNSLKRMVSIFSNEGNCKIRKCYDSRRSIPIYDGLSSPNINQNSYQLPHFQFNEENAPQNFIVCVCISEDSHDQILHNNQSPEQYRHSKKEEVEESRPDNARDGIGQARTSMAVSENLRKPFMGLGDGESIKKFYAEYNGKHEDGGDLFDSNEERLLFNDE